MPDRKYHRQQPLGHTDWCRFPRRSRRHPSFGRTLNMDTPSSSPLDGVLVEARIAYLASTSCRARVLSPCIGRTSQIRNLYRRQPLHRCKLHTTDSFGPERDFQWRRDRRKFPQRETRTSWPSPRVPWYRYVCSSFIPSPAWQRTSHCNSRLAPRISRSSLQARNHRPRKTKRYERGDPIRAQPMPGQS
jgi:hypothetical protein